MVLVWDGVDPDQMAAHFSSMMQKPTSDHERYLADYVVPKVNGIDTGQAPPPPARLRPGGRRPSVESQEPARISSWPTAVPVVMLSPRIATPSAIVRSIETIIRPSNLLLPPTKLNALLVVREQALFHEIVLDKLEHNQGLNITICISNSDPKKSFDLLKLLNMPFREQTVAAAKA